MKTAQTLNSRLSAQSLVSFSSYDLKSGSARRGRSRRGCGALTGVRPPTPSHLGRLTEPTTKQLTNMGRKSYKNKMLMSDSFWYTVLINGRIWYLLVGLTTESSEKATHG